MTSSPSRAPNLYFLKLAPAEEESLGRIEASRIASRIVASIPEHVSEMVQTAYAIKAIEEEDYASWSSDWWITRLRIPLLKDLTLLCAEVDQTGFQRIRYQELQQYPHLLNRITHGFTRKLFLKNKQEFIEELMAASRRETSRRDEASAIDEAYVVHVALSYKHVRPWCHGGTTDYETAEEAYEIINKSLQASDCVRVWIDQNLHRYSEDVPWFQKGFLPYAVMMVVSPLSKHGGFAIGCKRPWIWVETGLALSARGIHCKPSMRSTIDELIVFPGNSSLRVVFEVAGTIIGTAPSVYESVSQMLRTISWWTPDMLSHKDYDRANEFKKFVQWAKAQVVRLDQKGTLDLSTDEFEETILEDICWIKSLPHNLGLRRHPQCPYLRLEMDVEKAGKQMALMQASCKCRNQDGLYELVGKSNGLKNFCFMVSSGKLLLNLNPSERPTELRMADAEERTEVADDTETIKASRGGYSVWDRRFPFHKLPRFISCGTIFGRHYGFRHRLGEEGRNITLGGHSFTMEGFAPTGFAVEGVYVCRSSQGEIYLCESDVLCIRELSEDLQTELVMALSPQNNFPGIARILKAESDITNLQLTPRTCGTTTADVKLAIWRTEGEDVGDDEINIRRFRFGERLHTISTLDNCFGRMVYTFETTVVLEDSLGDLLHFKTLGDVEMTLSKIRLMMGSDEFRTYTNDGLSLGIGVFDGEQRYPHEFRLVGGEFIMCDTCHAMYSPINSMECSLSSDLRTRKIRARWGVVHKCSGRGQFCNIIGTAE